MARKVTSAKADTNQKSTEKAVKETAKTVKADAVKEVKEAAPVKAQKETPAKETEKTADKPAAIATKKDDTKRLETKAAVLVEEPKKEEKKAPAKRVVKKAEMKTEMVLQYAGKELTEKEILKKVKEDWTKVLKNKVGDLKSVKIYLKPEENKAYYVANGSVEGAVEL